MSRNGTPLPIPDDPRFQELADYWPQLAASGHPYPRSVWLGIYERFLGEHYPHASRADLNLTARHYAPFPLALGPNVP